MIFYLLSHIERQPWELPLKIIILISSNIKWNFIHLYKKTNNIVILPPKRWDISRLHVNLSLSIRISRCSKLFKPVSNYKTNTCSQARIPVTHWTHPSCPNVGLKTACHFTHCVWLYAPQVQTNYLLVCLFIVSVPVLLKAPW